MSDLNPIQTAVNDFVTAVEDVGIENCVRDDGIISPTGRGLYINHLPVMSPIVRLALTKEIHNAFIGTHPQQVTTVMWNMFRKIDNDVQSYDEKDMIDNRNLVDPSAQLAELAAQSALEYKGLELEKNFWTCFSNAVPNENQHIKYGDDFLAFVKKDSVKYYPEIEANWKKAQFHAGQNYPKVDFGIVCTEKHPRFTDPIARELAHLNRAKPTVAEPANMLMSEEEMKGIYAAARNMTFSNHDKALAYSRKTLLTQPQLSGQSLNEHFSFGKNAGPSYGHDILYIEIPTLFAHGEFLAQFKGNFAYHALSHMHLAHYQQASNFTGPELRNDVMSYMNQRSAEIGEQNVDLDIKLLTEATAVLKAGPVFA